MKQKILDLQLTYAVPAIPKDQNPPGEAASWLHPGLQNEAPFTKANETVTVDRFSFLRGNVVFEALTVEFTWHEDQGKWLAVYLRRLCPRHHLRDASDRRRPGPAWAAGGAETEMTRRVTQGPGFPFHPTARQAAPPGRDQLRRRVDVVHEGRDGWQNVLEDLSRGAAAANSGNGSPCVATWATPGGPASKDFRSLRGARQAFQCSCSSYSTRNSRLPSVVLNAEGRLLPPRS